MIQQPLQALLCPDPATVAEALPIAEVLAIMEQRRISCLLAVDDALRPTGIFTERDAVQLMATVESLDGLVMRDVMHHPVFTAPADLDYREAYRLMSERGFRHLGVVDAAGRLAGIVSEGDFLRHLGMEYLVELKTVASAMTPEPVTLPEHASLGEAVAVMARRRISCILVTRDDVLVGLLSERDLVRLAQQALDPATTCLSQVMHGPVQATQADYPLQAAAQQMQQAGIRRLAVLDQGRLVGLITRHDIVKALQGRYIEYLHETIQRQQQEMALARAQMQDLRQRAQHLSLMDQVSDAIFVVDAESAAFLEVNDQACRSLGYSREALLALDVPAISTSLRDPGAWQGFHATLRERGQMLLETGQRRHDGGILPVQINARLIEADGRSYVVAVARDLSHLREQEAQLKLQIDALNAAGNAIVITDTIPRILWANAAFSTLTGYGLAEAIGRKPHELVKSGKHDRAFYQHMWETILAGEVWHGEVVNRHKNGSLYDEDLTITPVRVDGQEITHFIAVKQDITARRAAEAALRESEQSYRGLFDSVSEAIYILDASGHFLDVNQGAERMYGYSREELIGRTPAFLFAPGLNDMSAIGEQIRLAFAGEAQHGEIWGRRKNGEVFPKDAWINKGRYFGRDVVIAVARDISERRAQEDELRHLATTDTLTGLANRRHFLDQMTVALARQQRHDTPIALLMLDLDRFKRVNDRHGHAVGDEVLRHIAEAMAASLRRVDLLGRLGGEEFAILLPDTTLEGAHEFAERLRQKVAAQTAATAAGKLPVTLSIGVTAFAPGDGHIDTILARADRALYRAKANGRNRVEPEAPG